jgi:ribosome biogenesis protein BMS1
MEDRAHKPHRPSQSGSKADKKGKGKAKGQGFNEKVHLKLCVILVFG